MTNPQLISNSTAEKKKRGKLSSKIRNKIRMPSLATSVQQSFGSSRQSNWSRKMIKRHSNWNGKSKTTYLLMT